MSGQERASANVTKRTPRQVPAVNNARGDSIWSWERAIVLVPWLLSVGTAAAGVWQFSVQQAAANSRPFLEKQLALTFEAADAAATLSTTSDVASWKAANQTFRRLHAGQVRIVEDRGLEKAMSDFVERLPPAEETKLDLPMTQLQPFSIEIARNSRVVIARSWNVNLAPLDNPPPN